MSPRASNSVGVTTLVLLLTAPQTAAAEDAQACIQAYEQTQTFRRSGKLRDARAEAAKCAVESCPPVLSKDCAKWIVELDQSIPTIVFDVKSASGEELTNVKVTADGKPLIDKLDGKSVVVDVGPHTFRFEPTDGGGKSAAVEQKTVIHEGDHNRKISVTLPAASAEGGAGGTGGGGDRPIPAMVYVFGGVGVVSLGVGTVFALSGLSKESDLDTCKPACSADAVNSVSTSYAFADIFLTAGVVAGLAAAYAYFTRPSVSSTTPTQPSTTGRLVVVRSRRAIFEF